MDISRQTIAVIGLGYVGLPLTVEFGKSRPVCGFDTNAARIAQLRAGLDNTLELRAPQLREAIYLQYSNDGADLSDCGVFIVTVPTPVDQLNQPDLGPLIEASQGVASAPKPGAVVIYESTVYPGCTEEVCVPIPEKYSGLQFNKDFLRLQPRVNRSRRQGQHSHDDPKEHRRLFSQGRTRHRRAVREHHQGRHFSGNRHARGRSCKSP